MALANWPPMTYDRIHIRVFSHKIEAIHYLPFNQVSATRDQLQNIARLLHAVQDNTWLKSAAGSFSYRTKGAPPVQPFFRAAGGWLECSMPPVAWWARIAALEHGIRIPPLPITPLDVYFSSPEVTNSFLRLTFCLSLGVVHAARSFRTSPLHCPSVLVLHNIPVILSH